MHKHKDAIVGLIKHVFDTIDNLDEDEEERFSLLVVVTSVLLHDLEKKKPEDGMKSAFIGAYHLLENSQMRELLGEIPGDT